MTRRLGACALTLAATSAVAAAQASAATISITTPCVIYDQATVNAGVPITGTGFTPGDQVNFGSSPGDVFGSASVGADGTFTSTFDPATVSQTKPVVSTFTLTATDDDNVAATATFQEAPVAADTKPAHAKPGKIVTFNFSGFAPGQPIYGHYLHGKKLVATKKFGVAQGACGTLSAQSSFFPGRQKFDLYTVQFDDTRPYAKTNTPRIVEKLTKSFV